MDINKARNELNGNNIDGLKTEDMFMDESDNDEFFDSSKINLTTKFWSQRKLNTEFSTSTPNKSCQIMQNLNIYNAKSTDYDPLEIVCHAPKYNGPFYTESKLKSLTVSEQIERIMNFHCKQSQNFQSYQRKSLVFAKWGKAIYPSNKVEESNENMDESAGEVEEETYISRGGRHMKRKIYTEDDEFQLLKKKKGKVESPKPKTKKMSNEEIMNKSSLFTDTPMKNSSATKTIEINTPTSKSNTVNANCSALNLKKSSKIVDQRKRCEILFDKCIEETNKSKKQEAEMNIFEESLKEISDDDMDYDLKITSSRIPRPSEPSFPDNNSSTSGIKKRVIPPVAGRRGYRRKQAYQLIDEPPQDNSDINNTIESIDFVKRNGRQNKKTTVCPICGKSFPQKEIEEHASTCGITAELEIENNLPNKDQAVSIVDSLICANCEQMFSVNTDYEVHVTECFRNKK
ncbi:PREDICTED: uncharacterized protein LOC108567864 [Nicrophorus vespilloides]|uniref:Uncharacterized protein LOC108567864 n=1 Tax=Nicrophorus vespilloides TaxID=110193 RepID=A0ABM1NB63_NICVS|nr:PREDICTED: uncharacterized protein LOC108567864 [Nicrophorus vespilloides]